MISRVVVFTIALTIGLSTVLLSEDLSNNPKSTSTGSVIQQQAQYYIGKWVGEWELPRGRHEANFIIKEVKEGKYHCTYSWGHFQGTMAPILPGSSNGIITFEGDNAAIYRKQNYTILFTKKDNDTFKARWERNGPTGPGRPAHYEGYFKRVK